MERNMGKGISLDQMGKSTRVCSVRAGFRVMVCTNGMKGAVTKESGTAT